MVRHSFHRTIGANQIVLATALLQKMLQYVPLVKDLTRPITDLWVLMRHGDSTMKWSACHGVYCAKILAHLKDLRVGEEWSLINGMHQSTPTNTYTQANLRSRKLGTVRSRSEFGRVPSRERLPLASAPRADGTRQRLCSRIIPAR